MADGTLVSTTVVRDELRLPWEKCKMPRKFPAVAQIDRQAGRQAGRQTGSKTYMPQQRGNTARTRG